MKTFKELADLETNSEEEWTKEDLINLINELEPEDISYVTDVILDIIAFDSNLDWDTLEDTNWDDYMEYEDNLEDNLEVNERMTSIAKKKASLKRRKPAFKKAMRLKKKCMTKYGKKVRNSKCKSNTFVCGTDGKIHKGMLKNKRRLMAKTRKRNKSKIIK